MLLPYIPIARARIVSNSLVPRLHVVGTHCTGRTGTGTGRNRNRTDWNWATWRRWGANLYRSRLRWRILCALLTTLVLVKPSPLSLVLLFRQKQGRPGPRARRFDLVRKSLKAPEGCRACSLPTSCSNSTTKTSSSSEETSTSDKQHSDSTTPSRRRMLLPRPNINTRSSSNHHIPPSTNPIIRACPRLLRINSTRASAPSCPQPNSSSPLATGTHGTTRIRPPNRASSFPLGSRPNHRIASITPATPTLLVEVKLCRGTPTTRPCPNNLQSNQVRTHNLLLRNMSAGPRNGPSAFPCSSLTLANTSLSRNQRRRPIQTIPRTNQFPVSLPGPNCR